MGGRVRVSGGYVDRDFGERKVSFFREWDRVIGKWVLESLAELEGYE